MKRKDNINFNFLGEMNVPWYIYLFVFLVLVLIQGIITLENEVEYKMRIEFIESVTDSRFEASHECNVMIRDLSDILIDNGTKKGDSVSTISLDSDPKVSE